jgi:DNA recombination protein RmuC
MIFQFDPLSAVIGLGIGILCTALLTWAIWYKNRISQLDHQRVTLEVQSLHTTMQEQQTRTNALEAKLATQLHELMDSKSTIAQQNAEKNALQSTINQREKDLADTEHKFTLKFENLANRIFEEKTSKFKLDSQAGLEQTLNPLKENLAAFQKKIDDSFGIQAREQTSLQREIARIVTANEKITLQAENLANALKGESKIQGNWGEMILEKILEDSGLRKDIDYIIQGSGMGMKHIDDGSALKPDFTVLLPGDRHIIIDSKVSLTHYERHFSEPDVQQKELYFNQFLASIRDHVTGLAQRRYQDSAQAKSPDFVLMFMPIEGALISALQKDQELHNFAWKKRIIIVCPSTLFATLRTIESMWRLDRQNKNAVEIARQGGDLHDKIVGFVEDMENIGSKLDSTRTVYDNAFKKLSKGTGNIVKRTNDMKLLGIKISKEIPEKLLDDDVTIELNPQNELQGTSSNSK